MKDCFLFSLAVCLLLTACADSAWNNPYPEKDGSQRIYYDSFTERPKHLDPASSYSANEYIFLGQIYEPILQYHFLKRPYQLTTLTAESIPVPVYYDVSGNQLENNAPTEQIAKVVYTITIKPGIEYQPHPALAKNNIGHYRYHDMSEVDLQSVHTLSDFEYQGTRELIAEDYVYQIKRMAHPTLHSPIAGLMMKYIQGLQDLSQELTEINNKHSRQYSDLREVDLSGVKVIDQYTYQITLKEKYPQFIYWLSMYFFSPMPWEADVFYQQAGMEERNITLDWYPIGTGPFMLTENNPNRRMVMVRNPNFRGEAYPTEGEGDDSTNGLLKYAGESMPFIDKAIYSLEKENIPTWNKFLQGYYDTSGIVSDSFDQAITISASGEADLTQQMQERDIRLITAVTTSTSYIGFNIRNEVVGGDGERARLLRRAISIAVDIEELISIFANGRGIASQGPIPPGIFGHVAGEAGFNPYIYDWKNGKPVRKSIEEAKQLLAEAGYENGRDNETGEALVLFFDSPLAGPGSKAYYDWLLKQFKKLNINLVIRATDYNRFQEKMLNGTSQIYRWGWNADYPDPENFLFLLYGPNRKIEINGENASNYENTEFDALFNKMKSMNNGEARQAVINKMVSIVQKDAPWIWGYHPVAFSLHHSWYENAKPNLMANNKLKYKAIDNKLRNQSREKWNQPLWWPVLIILIILVISILPAYRTYKRKQQAKIE